MQNHVAFLNEWGDNSLDFEKKNENGIIPSTHFIVTALTAVREDTIEIRRIISAIQKRHFQGSALNSNVVDNDYELRKLILEDLCEAPFQIFALVVDKRQLISEGLRYKGSFYKFLHGLADRELFRIFPDLQMIAGKIGSDSFMEGFIKYVHQNHISNLFNESSFGFVNAQNEAIVQAADFVAGTLARCYDETVITDQRQQFLDLMQPKLMTIKFWPDVFNPYLVKNDKSKILKIVPPHNETLNGDQEITNSIFNYMETWNDVFMTELSCEINSLVRKKGIKRIVLFCHGYNVPYSLAQIQANSIIDSYADQLGETSEEFNKILFLKVFWPSLDKKKKDFRNNGLKFSNNIAFSTTRYYKYITNRAFNVGLNLRRLMNSIEYNDRVDVIAHSSGSTAVSSMLINPIQKINLVKNDSPINRKYIQMFESNSENYRLPDKKYNVFLNASSKPGVGTFNTEDMSSPVHKKYTWIIGHNRKDKVLNKQLYFLRFPDSFGNTRLGGNRKDEIKKLQIEIENNPLKISENFRFPRLGYQKNLFGHDFFCYLLQDNFQKEFRKFMK